eukprot:410761-Pelagomonas_calceolata.AAC.2
MLKLVRYLCPHLVRALQQLLGESENDVINSNKPQQSGTEMPPGKSEQQTKAKGGKKKEEPKKKGNAGKEGVPVVRGIGQWNDA